jgi:ribosome-associated translation inhibitor RaiA
MRLSIRARNCDLGESFTNRIEKAVVKLGTHTTIDEARVGVQHEPSESPPFQVTLHLVAPGPDFYSEAHDHTPEAALEKALHQAGCKIRHRTEKRARRRRSELNKTTATQNSRVAGVARVGNGR